MKKKGTGGGRSPCSLEARQSICYQTAFCDCTRYWR
jgi:hypothetical protein